MAVERATLGGRLKRVREIRGWRQEDMARVIGISPAALSQYESDRAEPRWWAVARVVEALGVPFSTFSDEDVDWHDVERAILEKRIRDLYAKPYDPDIDIGKDNVNSNNRQLVAVLA
jgi:transcriptional regulator with XRE-family HTH domain